MHWALAQSDDENAELREYVRGGRLFDVQKWIAAQRPLYRKGSRKAQPLEIAVDKGFHSMVEILASAWPDQHSLQAALHQAAGSRKVDLVWLLLRYVTDIRSVDLENIAGCNDKNLMRYFLDRWTEIDSETGLTDMILAMPRPLIGLIREYAPSIPESQKQLAMALKYFVRENHLKWIALTIWMGGNARLAAPDRFNREDDPEEWTSALMDAVFTSNLEALKIMKPSPDCDDLNSLLGHVFVFRDTAIQVAEYLVERGANINNKPNGGSSVLDGLFREPRYRFDLYRDRRFGYGDIDRVKRWISRGARWVPDDQYAYRDVRAAICDLDPKEAWKFMEFLSETLDVAQLTVLCNTQKICRTLDQKPAELRRKIADFYAKRQRAEERRNFYPRNPSQTSFVQRRPKLLGIKETLTSRRKLYEEIWSRPVIEIAAEYRIGPEQIVYLCNSHNIPRPKTGHWQKVSIGKPVRVKPLPDQENNPDIRITSYYGLPEICSASARAHARGLIERLASPGLAVNIPQDFDKVHRLLDEYIRVQGVKCHLMNDMPPYGRSRRPPLLDIKVRADMKTRAERVMNALLFFLEEFGLTVGVSVSEHGYAYTQASIFGNNVGFSLDQEAGKMRLNLHGGTFGLWRTWSDGREQLVEECFADFATRLVYAAALKCGSEEP